MIVTAALYARVSTPKQEEEATIDSQVAAIERCMQDGGYDLPSEFYFLDKAVSGARLDRPALDRLRHLASDGAFAMVVCYIPDRLSRSYLHQWVIMDELQRNGGQGAGGPTQLEDMYPETEFRFTRRGQSGPDVVVVGGKHPSEYPGSTWPSGVDHGDFKPDTPFSAIKFQEEIASGKLPADTVPLPYDWEELELLDEHRFSDAGAGR
jgi:hypothetical protein